MSEEIPIDERTDYLLELIAANLGVSTDEMAREALQHWLNSHFENN